MKKKKQKEVKPEYVRALDNSAAYNYDVYNIKAGEKVVLFIVALAIGSALGYLFYGGLAKDEFGEPTTTTYILNILFCGVSTIITFCILLPYRRNSVIEKRRKELRRQFRELLDTLTTSIGSGKNVTDSFMSASKDLSLVYSEDDYIMLELKIIRNGIDNGLQIEDLLTDFGQRSGIEDIISFAGVFETCAQRGGNLKDIIRTVQEILADKMSVEEQIETVVSSSKMEQKIMLVMPVFIVGIIKMSDSDFANNYATTTGVISTTVGLALFIFAYLLGKKMLNIKV